MKGLLETLDTNEREDEFSFKNFFVPLTTTKAIIWIVIIGFIVFFNILFNGFVWDDFGYILDNPQVHIFNLSTILGQSLFNYKTADYYRPLPAFYFTLTYLAFHNLAFFYHFLQLVFHILSSCLVFILFKHFLKKSTALFLSLLFLIHPIQVESVAYIAQTVVPLAFIFGVTALLISFANVLDKRKLFTIVTLLFLSFLTKETSVLFIGIVILYRILFKTAYFKEILVGVIVLFICYFILRIGIGHEYFPLLQNIPVAQISLQQRLLVLPAVLSYYLISILFPNKLAVDQLWIVQSANLQQFYFPLFIDCVFFGLIIFFGKYLYSINKSAFKVYLFFLLWFIGGLVFILQLFPLDMTVADRWFYNPFVGLLGIFGVFAEVIIQKRLRLQRLCLLILIIVLSLLAVRTMVRNANWYNEISLFTHDSQISDNDQLETFIGLDYMKQQNYAEVYKYYTKSVELSPNAINLFDLGSYYQAFQNPAKAKYYYLKAYALTLQQSNRSKRLLLSVKMGEYYMLYDNPKKAIVFITSALHEYPDSMQLWAELALVEYKQNNQDAALSAAEKAQQLNANQSTQSLYEQILNRQQIDYMDNGTLSPWLDQLLYHSSSFIQN